MKRLSHTTKLLNAALAAFFFWSISPTALFGQITLDGTMNETAWGSAVSTSSGGPTPGFGAGHEINALYVAGDANYIYFGLAGNVQNNNRILLFIDSQSGGKTNGNFGRAGAPQGIDDFNSNTTFDSGFAPDFVTVIGTNGMGNYFFDFYTLSGTAGSGGGPNNYLGDSAGGGSGSDEAGVSASPANSSNTQGFEFRLDKSALGFVPSGDGIKLMAMYISDGGFLSNQFLSPAGSGQGNFSGGTVNFDFEPPNFITIPDTQLPITLLDFNAKLDDKGAVQLRWTTGSETNNDYMEVERSTDQRTWKAVCRTPGQGNSSTPQRYACTDWQPASGTNYYRLRQVDFDGTTSFSSIVKVKVTGNDLNIQLYPLPAQNLLHITGLDIEKEGYTVTISNLQGQVLASLPWQGVPIDVSSLGNGLYLFQANDPSGLVVGSHLFPISR